MGVRGRVIMGVLLGLVGTGVAMGDCDDPLHVDVEMAADLPASALLVGSGDFCDGQFVPDFSVRVFSAEFVNNPLLPPFFQGRAFNPGFNAGSGAFPAFATVSFNILGPLRKWDGTLGDFDAVPEETLTVQTGQGAVTTPVDEGVVVAGVPITASDSSGSFHVHPTFALGEPKSAGVYLLALEMTTPTLSLAASEPIYIVFNQQSDQGLVDAAVAYVEDVLVTPIEPGCVGDLNEDGVVDTSDLGILLGAFGATGAGDLDGDGITNTVDLGILLGAFGVACE